MERGTTAKILDHGYVKLIDFMGSDEAIVEAARMSTGRGFESWDPYKRCKKCDYVERIDHPATGAPLTAENGGSENCPVTVGGKHIFEKFPNGDMGMLDRLWRKKHATPFECGGEIVIEVQAPIMVFREWHRHRTQSYNEFSARYAQMPNLHYVPELSRIQKQSKSNKQGSDEAFPMADAERIRLEIIDQQDEVYESYDDWCEEGLAKEIARVNTPVSRYSKMRAKTDIRNWLAFLNLRMRPSAQWEIRQYANAVSDILKSLYPRTWFLFEEYDLYGASFSRTELAILRRNIGLGSIQMDAQTELSGTKLTEFMEKLEKGGLEILG